ncbi:MAG TPA: cbb3-type cytochrome c oxidase subunit 3 [candidate division Zixibacteria bacterium]|nr:cbb3-type cytochrome c oxidase subunit 3 [candidate division Zixibacteria bacterium]
MIKETLQSLVGVEIYPIISLIIFFVVFIMVVLWALMLDKDVIAEMENIPLDNDMTYGDSIDV